MTFTDPETGLVINCQPWEYEQLKPKYIKTKWETWVKNEPKHSAKNNKERSLNGNN